MSCCSDSLLFIPRKEGNNADATASFMPTTTVVFVSFDIYKMILRLE